MASANAYILALARAATAGLSDHEMKGRRVRLFGCLTHASVNVVPLTGVCLMFNIPCSHILSGPRAAETDSQRKRQGN